MNHNETYESDSKHPSANAGTNTDEQTLGRTTPQHGAPRHGLGPRNHSKKVMFVTTLVLSIFSLAAALVGADSTKSASSGRVLAADFFCCLAK